jgi:SAM domain (Sterile alpha motif)
MQEIADWLTKLGLPEYAGAFAENGIDVSVLPHLTDHDLKDIGVLLGHRRKILAAVAELPGKSQSTSEAPLVAARDRHTTERLQPAPSGRDERIFDLPVAASGGVSTECNIGTAWPAFSPLTRI